jgi:Arc/MetJ family transcription regulator
LRYSTDIVRTTVDIDDGLLAEAQKLSGLPTKKKVIEEALRLMVKLRGQQQTDQAFGKYSWRGTLARSRQGRGVKV